MARFLILLLAALAACMSAPSWGQSAQSFGALPPPVDLEIRNIRQETDSWCWAAVAQQVIEKQRGKSPPQCALVAMANGQMPSFCCSNPARCRVAGTLGQIQRLIRNFGQQSTAIAPPTDSHTLYRTLQAGRPIILAIRNSRYDGHVVVLTGMTWYAGEKGPVAVLHINDPLGVIAERLFFDDLLPRWEAAIVVR